ncbi:MAG: hypothetical protein JRL30_10995 [Deltaproteobacteria bacterium]|nr:hypothetical protein [Deltaproteobacteria bacterium]
MNRNFSKELENTRNRLSAAMKNSIPTKEFGANLILGMVQLHLLAKKIRQSRDLEERRCLTHEFTKGRSAMERGIRALKKKMVTQYPQETDALRRALS